MGKTAVDGFDQADENPNHSISATGQTADAGVAQSAEVTIQGLSITKRLVMGCFFLSSWLGEGGQFMLKVIDRRAVWSRAGHFVFGQFLASSKLTFTLDLNRPAQWWKLTINHS